ncbi:MAG: hypothetical protein IKM13_04270 [Clostridia bacterium]|nr:hypothetical protein [Clostridia bacterium]
MSPIDTPKELYSYDGKGQLILVDARVGKNIVYNYDLGGNPNTYRGATLTWNGRRLTSYNGASYWYVPTSWGTSCM